MKHWEYSDYYKEEIKKLELALAEKEKELELNKKLLARQCDLAREAETETERWKTMAQRHNPSGCCCQIDENNGDPKMVEPCAFHAEWKTMAIETLLGKVSTESVTQPHIDFCYACGTALGVTE